jgi:hypothetical protein
MSWVAPTRSVFTLRRRRRNARPLCRDRGWLSLHLVGCIIRRITQTSPPRHRVTREGSLRNTTIWGAALEAQRMYSTYLTNETGRTHEVRGATVATVGVVLFG